MWRALAFPGSRWTAWRNQPSASAGFFWSRQALPRFRYPTTPVGSSETATRNAASASAGRPSRPSATPRSQWVVGTAGSSRTASRNAASASASLPSRMSRRPRSAWAFASADRVGPSAPGLGGGPAAGGGCPFTAAAGGAGFPPARARNSARRSGRSASRASSANSANRVPSSFPPARTRSRRAAGVSARGVGPVRGRAVVDIGWLSEGPVFSAVRSGVAAGGRTRPDTGRARPVAAGLVRVFSPTGVKLLPSPRAGKGGRPRGRMMDPVPDPHPSAPMPGPAPPSVSVVMPVHNGAELVGRAYESLRRQTFPDWELVAVDDHSADDTAAALDRIAAADPRVTVVRHPVTRGPSAARNTALLRARGPLVAYLDHDDEFYPDHLGRAWEWRDRADVLVFRY